MAEKIITPDGENAYDRDKNVLKFEDNISTKVQEKFREILSTFSKKGSLKILDEARTKLHSKRDIWEKFGLSKKQYYLRLRSLRDANLVRKEGEGYILTDLGERIANILFKLGLTVAEFENGEKNIRRGDSYIVNLAGPIENSTQLKSLSSGFEKNLDQVSSISDYETYVAKIVKMISSAAEVLLFAGVPADQRVLRAFLDLDENVDLKTIVSKKGLSEIREIGKNLLRKELEELRNLLNGSNKKCRRLPYSFVLQDREKTVVEIRNILHKKSFYQGFAVEGRKTYQSFRDLFEEVYEGSKKVELLS